MLVVPDSSPLVVLGKLERVDLLAILYGAVILTPGVWEEAVINGKAIGARDAAYLEKAALQNRLGRTNLTERELELARGLRQQAGIDRGESEVLAVARCREGLAIFDDKAARALAVGLGVDHIGTVGLLFEAFLQQFLTYQEILDLLQKLASVAWISPELMATVLRKAGEVTNR